MKYKLRGNFRTDENGIYDILENRKVPDIEKFINPTIDNECNPFDLDNIEDGAQMLLTHLKKNSKICIIVDADSDGINSAAILWNYIKTIYPEADLHYWMHEGKGHGLSDVIDHFINEVWYDLILIPDAGSFDVKYFWQLNEVGTDVLVLDHHTQQFLPDGSPVINDCPTAIVINNQLSPKYANKDLCGAGVTYRFCNVLDKILDIYLSKKFIDLAAVGNIGDVMFQGDPETRYIIMEGLHHIHNKGLIGLIEEQEYVLKERAKPPYMLTPLDVAFYVCPLINAIIRVGTMDEKRILFTAFTDPMCELQSTKRGAKDGDIELAYQQAARIAKNVKAKQDRLKDKALDLIDYKIQKDNLNENNIIIVELEEEDNIPNELTGVLAQNIVSKYNRPAFVVRLDSHEVLRGSARNNSNFQDLPSLKTFLDNSGYFEMVAGRESAFGLALPLKNMQSFVNFMNTQFSATSFDNCYLVDYVLDANQDIYNLLYILAEHKDYYGNGVDEPTVIIKNIPLKYMFIMGNNKDCLKINYNNIDYVRFKDIEYIEALAANRDKLLTIYGKPALNTFNGKTSVQIIINDYELIDNNSKYEF